MAKTMRKIRVGSVVSTRMDKTAVVEIVWKQRHRVYRKQMRRVTRFYVHDPEVECRIGDTVRIQETRPISRTKHWRLLEILTRRAVADVRAIDLEGDAVIEPLVDADTDYAGAEDAGTDDASPADDMAEENTDDDEDA